MEETEQIKMPVQDQRAGMLRDNKKRWICLWTCLCMLLQVVSGAVCAAAAERTTATAVTFSALNDESVFIRQSKAKWCTLASAVMMVRRAAMLSGNEMWRNIDEASVRGDAWVENAGLKWDFQTAGITVAHKNLTSVDELKNVLEQHPEGVVLYDSDKPHAILVTDYTNGVFYCSDPGQANLSGRYPISKASITAESADWYWYVKSPSNLTVQMDDPLGIEIGSGGLAGSDKMDNFQLNGNLPGNGTVTEDENQTGSDSNAVYGQEYTSGSLKYRVIHEKGNAAVCLGFAKAKTTAVIPAEVKLNGKKYKVVQIADRAFENSAKLKSITIGTHVTSIGERAFANCKKLNKIIILAEKLQKIGTGAFDQVYKKIQINLEADLSDTIRQTDLIGTFAALLTGTSLPGAATVKIN